MDEIQIYNYLNRVKPFYKKHEAKAEAETEDQDQDVPNEKAHVTRHTDTLQHVGGGVYKVTNPKVSGGSDVNIILFD
jgi:hypothetical protein